MDLAAERRGNFLAWMAAFGLNANRIAEASGLKYTTVKSYVDGDTQSLKGDNEAKIAAAYGLPVEGIFGSPALPEDEQEPNHLASWRRRAHMSAVDLSAALGVTLDVLDMLESGRVALTAKWLRRYAGAVGVEPGMLLRDPDDVDDLYVVANNVDPENRTQAVRMLKSLAVGVGS